MKKKIKIYTNVALVVSVLFLLIYPVFADEPLPPPAVETIWSMDKGFCAVMDPEKKITTIYQVNTGGKKIKSWAMYGWFRVAALSNDGEHFVVGYWGMSLLTLDHKKDEVMLYFFKRGELINYVTLDQLVKDPSNLRRTVSHLYWGNYLGFNKDEYYVIETVENRKILFDINTGEPVEEK